jgi:glycosyltransferase involved in cell wall biosynthesis
LLRPAPARWAPGSGSRNDIRILTFTTLFPNTQQPAHGVFVENRLVHLVASGQVASRVVAPVPWFPFGHRAFGEYAAFAKVATSEERRGLAIHHPRFPVIPKVGMSVQAGLLYLATRRYVRRMIAESGDIDLIDAHYFYPDGVAAALLGRTLKRPVVITARGTDVSLIPQFELPRRQVLWAARQAAGLITVCQALKDALVDLGVDAGRIRVLRNGVDLARFRPLPRDEARRRWDVTGPTLLSVGLLIPRKGHDIVIGALPELPGMSLLIVGAGPERNTLERLAASLGVAERVRFLGVLTQDELAEVYGAVDMLVLASSREGWANVLLESMACGTPVVASDIWGNGEVVAEPAAGRLFMPRTASALALAIRRLSAALPDRAATRAYAERFSWDATTGGQISLFRDILEGGAPA